MKKTWPLVSLGEVLRKSGNWITLQPEQTYREVTVRLWGKGVTLRREVLGAEIASDRRLRVKPGQFIASRIDARNGAFGLIPDELDGGVVTNDFPVFEPDKTRLHIPFLGWMSKTATFVDLCKAASEGTTNRVRLKEDRFLTTSIHLPSMEEQRRIVDRIEEVASKLTAAEQLSLEVTSAATQILNSAYRSLLQSAPTKRLSEVAPLVRRPATIAPGRQYPQVSVRSFGKGTFHNPPLIGSEITWQKPYLVSAGDVLISNIKAWEGAIAVARPEDDSRFGSHRYLTFVPVPDVATARWVCFYLLSPEGLHFVGDASPGSADRNRTTSARGLLEIPVPIPAYERQLWFGHLFDKVKLVEQQQADAGRLRKALLPTVLHRAFKGEL
jgi:type I restriction enzyme S subunit